MFYPKNIEEKIGFTEIRQHLRALCLSEMGRERIDDMAPSSMHQFICLLQSQLKEMMLALEEEQLFPTSNFHDLRSVLKRIRIEGTFIEAHEMWDMKRSLETIHDLLLFVRATTTPNGNNSIFHISSHEAQPRYPVLCQISQGINSQPQIIAAINRIIDKFGDIKDNASPQLTQIRTELNSIKSSISGTLNSILRHAQKEGLVEQNIAPTLRDGRLVIPVAPALKRKIKGILHDESATGKTIFIEPTEVVEANNRIRELEGEERREITRILQNFTNELRPVASDLIQAYAFLGTIDFIRAKALMAKAHAAVTITPEKQPLVDWGAARHPLLEASLRKHGKNIVPLDIEITTDHHIVVISGPNAGGKSICLKTVGLLQYMLQCGLAIPVNESSRAGLFTNIMIDIGDEQSIDDDLSTYSSHLINMKSMMRAADCRTLLLIDEFGGGTEPTIGGAMAEAILNRFVKRKAFAIITTHYQNLKQYASTHEGVVNGAMLYDRAAMHPLFTLSVGHPGSSFAIEIARKIGIPDDVINDASEIVGQDYISADKYLQDIVRDKLYWEQKRQQVHHQEKKLQEENERLQKEIEDLRSRRSEILGKAREQAQEMLSKSNARIEATIKGIKEAQAEHELTKSIRQELNSFKDRIHDENEDELINKKMRQIEERKKRKLKRKNAKTTRVKEPFQEGNTIKPLLAGDTVRIKGQTSVGTIESIDEKIAVVTFGIMRTSVKSNRLEHAEKPAEDMSLQISRVGRNTRETIDERKINFRQDIDLRGMRAEEALNAVQYFIDDASMLGVSRVRILHGTGGGVLRTLIRQYLSKVSVVRHYADEHVQFGGAGITVVDL